MKIHAFAIAGLLSCLITACNNNSKELSQAVKSLQQVDSAASVGTNIGNYATQVISAKTEVDTYLLKDKDSETAKKLSKVLNSHLAAVDWWRCDLSQAESFLKDEYDVASECRDAILPRIFELSPDIKKEAEQAIATKPMRHKSDSLDKSAMLQMIWQETSSDTKSLFKDTNQ
ncbi:MAG: hypothetical protein HWQ38_24260 [Nostoc sp. NMS7]|uniref:hypothetical protein n=1 Tax=Nostoc sp. NMS7 TaxID=2815391 RepID=UPI0025F11198|nr:hypothetical protein [Nostoc sp. NMS7]MBN3949408.1 hypothetical protein [Nostoc sp. NMS7]